MNWYVYPRKWLIYWINVVDSSLFFSLWLYLLHLWGNGSFSFLICLLMCVHQQYFKSLFIQINWSLIIQIVLCRIISVWIETFIIVCLFLVAVAPSLSKHVIIKGEMKRKRLTWLEGWNWQVESRLLNWDSQTEI